MYMELDQIQCKFPKISNGGCASTIVTQREKMDDDDEEVDNRRRSNPNNGASADPGGGAVGLYSWPASRIVRVSRATGGKDRHSKVLTSKGLRDRRVRLSVNTAIEFYDLQDRLGYDQPSKAVEWLLTAAATSIAELPPMNPPFLLANRPPEEENMSAVSTGADQRMITLDSVTDRGHGSRNRGGGSRNRGGAQKEAKSSSSSETSRGSGLSISRSENRVRAREKAKERENENSSYVSSFTELLNGGGLNYINGGGGMEDPVCCDQRAINNENSEHQSNFFPKFPLDYFSSGLSLPPATASPAPHLFSAAADHHPEVQPFSFASDNLVSANNRGTLQSNFSSSAPPSLHYHPSFFGGGNHRHLLPGFDGRLQVYESGDGERNDGRQSGPKRREKP